MTRSPLEVVAALVQDDTGAYLLCRRPPGTHLAGLWEFPGGKREPGEALADSLARELSEELGAAFAVDALVATVPWRYPEREVVLHFFRCRHIAGRIEPREGQELAWVPARELSSWPLPPADAALVASLAAAME